MKKKISTDLVLHSSEPIQLECLFEESLRKLDYHITIQTFQKYHDLSCYRDFDLNYANEYGSCNPQLLIKYISLMVNRPISNTLIIKLIPHFKKYWSEEYQAILFSRLYAKKGYINDWEQVEKDSKDNFSLCLNIDEETTKKEFNSCLKNQQYTAALVIFAKANDLDLFGVRYSSSIFALILNLTDDNFFDKTINNDYLLDLISYIGKNFPYSGYPSEDYATIFYSRILNNIEKINNWEDLEKACQRQLKIDYDNVLFLSINAISLPAINYLLQTKKTDINQTGKFWYSGEDVGMSQGYCYTQYQSTWLQITLTPLQLMVVILTRPDNLYSGAKLAEALSLFVEYDKHCIKSQDNLGRHIYFYLDRYARIKKNEFQIHKKSIETIIPPIGSLNSEKPTDSIQKSENNLPQVEIDERNSIEQKSVKDAPTKTCNQSHLAISAIPFFKLNIVRIKMRKMNWLTNSI
ncbi:MAG: hypothetical protein H0T84_00200 [Tatlockia sp.]|nr:hypothetical protein [Tatlockia sp.]